MYGFRLIWSLIYATYGKGSSYMSKTYQFSLHPKTLTTPKNSIKFNRDKQLTWHTKSKTKPLSSWINSKGWELPPLKKNHFLVNQRTQNFQLLSVWVGFDEGEEDRYWHTHQNCCLSNTGVEQKKTINWQIGETGIMQQMHSDKLMGIKFDILKLLSIVAALKENMETY